MGRGHKSSVLNLYGRTVKKPGVSDVEPQSSSLGTLGINGWTVSSNGQVLEHSAFCIFLCK